MYFFLEIDDCFIGKVLINVVSVLDEVYMAPKGAPTLRKTNIFVPK